jgi:hypothetical protein
MQANVKCEVRTLVFQRQVSFHSAIEALPTDDEAKKLARADETLVEMIGASHLHAIEVPDPVADAETFADAVAAAKDRLATEQAEAAKIDQATRDDIKVLLSVGRSVQDVAMLLGVDPAVVQLVIA